MTVFHGTDASEVIVGTAGDDVFYSSKGQDILDGGEGWDKVFIDYTVGGAGESRAHNIWYMFDGLYGAFSDVFYPATETLHIEEFDVRTGEASDQYNVDLSQITTPWKISIDAGGGTGFDTVSLRVRFDSPAMVGTVSGGTLTSGNLTLKNFEQFELHLGTGNDQLTLGDGRDVVQAGSGADIIDGAGNDDTLEGEAGGDTLRGGDGNDRLYADDDYSAVDLGSEIDNLNGGAGDDLVSIGYGDSGNGGTGTDRLSLSLLSGTTGIVLDLTAMFNGGTLNLGGGTITGFERYDIIYGTNFNDTITTGNAPNAGFFGSSGVFGYAGDDRITSGTQMDTINGGEGNDILHAGAGDDRASGDEGNDQVFGEAGNDVLWGGGGDDKAYGGDGNDQILAGEGVDRIAGEAGDDLLYGEGGDDLMEGGAGNDGLSGGFGNDNLQGGAGDDTYIAVDAGDTVVEAAGAGTDTILTQDAAYSLAGLANVENLTGSYIDQNLTGNGAANLIDGQLGADTMTGGGGNDVYMVDNEGDRVVEAAGAGTDEVRSSISWALEDNVENLVLAGFSDSDGVGNDLANTITGNSGSNILYGGGGDDRLSGGAGIDVLYGGLGTDILDGGTEPNGYLYLAREESAGATVDTIKGFKTGIDLIDVSATLALSVNWTFSAGVSTVTVDTVYGAMTIKVEGVVAKDDFILTDGLIGGTAGNDTLQGTADTDIIFGGAGADTMTGGAGDDYYFVDNGGDKVVEIAGGGIDGVESTASYVLGAEVEYLLLAGTAAINGTGNALDNLLFGNDAANILDGGAGDDGLDGGGGADRLIGGIGNDLYFVDHSGDVVSEAAGAGTDEVLTTLATYTLAANVENLTGVSTSGQILTGNALANLITGSEGNDRLDGGLGADLLAGGFGDDLYLVAAGDTVSEDLNAGTDEVRTSLAAYTLAANVEKLTGTSASGQTLTGNALANILTAGGGNDVLDGGLGPDAMTGGLGNDVYYVDGGDSIVDAGGSDEVRTGMFMYQLADGVETLTGTSAFGQTLRGNALGNSISGGAGSDYMLGGDGNDVYLVGAGDAVEELFGQGVDEVRTSLAAYTLSPNIDRLTGLSAAGQILTGNDLANAITGGAGNDVIDGGLGADAMDGGLGNDRYFIDDAGDTVADSGGVDEIRTSLADTTAAAGVENITGLFDYGQALRGNALANVIAGAAGADQMFGGLGNDVYLVRAGDNVIENAGEGTDEVRTALAAYTLGANVERLTGTSAAGQSLNGNGLSNLVTGGAGNDVIAGGAGTDQLAGGLGNDVYTMDTSDTIVEAGNAGIDEVRTAIAAYTLGANVENLTGTSSAGQSLTGNGLANRLTGGGGNDMLNGGDGNDTLDGGAGSDQLTGGLGNDVYVTASGDVVTEAANAGTDEVQTALAAYTLDANVERLTGTSGAGQTLTGNGLSNLITGGVGNDVIAGGSGADQLAGGLGNDVYTMDTSDTIVEAVNAGIDEVRTAIAAYTLGANVENLTGTSSAGQALTGNGLANRITGGGGNDVLDGGAGNDTLAGGNGADLLVGGTGADSLKGGAGADVFRYDAAGDSTAGATDLIGDFQVGVDKIDLHLIDANTLAAGDQAFHWIGANAFSGTGAGSAGELRVYQSGAYWWVAGDTNGDGTADLVIALTPQGAILPAQGDFLL
jgi:Ca2+-binding RTX toxin-like protein